jgi:queuosine precursor transporter
MVASPPAPRHLDVVTAIFITTLIVSNLIASKTASLFGVTVGVGVFVFPVSYIVGDVLTEVYGYGASRRVIWLGFGAGALAALVLLAADLVPPSPGYPHQAAFHTILGQSPYALVASLAAYWTGEFCNSYVLAKLKVRSRGRWLWLRTIGSTVVGQAVDSLIFYPCAFFVLPALFGFSEGVWSRQQLVAVMINNYVIKILVEAAFTPLTYRVVALLKRREGLDVYDRDTDFNPFILNDRSQQS